MDYFFDNLINPIEIDFLPKDRKIFPDKFREYIFSISNFRMEDGINRMEKISSIETKHCDIHNKLITIIDKYPELHQHCLTEALREKKNDKFYIRSNF